MKTDLVFLWQNYVANRTNKKLRDKLVMYYMPLVEKIASRMVVWLPSYIDSQDLCAYGVLGLIASVEKFNPSLGIKFETFASWRIKGEILDFLRSQDILSKQQRAKLRQIKQIYSDIEQEKGGPVSEQEVAERMGCSIEEVWELLKLSNISHSLSLDKSISEDCSLKDVIASDNDLVKEVDSKLLIEKIEELIKEMDEKTQQILDLYFMEELKLKEIGQILGISESRVSQILSKTLFEIRRALEKEGIQV